MIRNRFEYHVLQLRHNDFFGKCLVFNNFCHLNFDFRLFFHLALLCLLDFVSFFERSEVDPFPAFSSPSPSRAPPNCHPHPHRSLWMVSHCRSRDRETCRCDPCARTVDHEELNVLLLSSTADWAAAAPQHSEWNTRIYAELKLVCRRPM